MGVESSVFETWLQHFEQELYSHSAFLTQEYYWVPVNC